MSNNNNFTPDSVKNNNDLSNKNSNNNTNSSNKTPKKKSKIKTKKYNTKVDWLKVQQEYIEGDISLAKLANKYNVDPSTVQKHSQQEGWVSKKEEFKRSFTKKVIEKKTELLATRAVDVNIALYSSYNKALAIVNDILDHPEIHLCTRGIYSLDRLERLTRSMNNIQNGQMLAVGIVPATEMKKLELMQRKLEIEEASMDKNNTVVQDNSFVQAIEGSAKTVWEDDEDMDNCTTVDTVTV